MNLRLGIVENVQRNSIPLGGTAQNLNKKVARFKQEPQHAETEEFENEVSSFYLFIYIFYLL